MKIKLFSAIALTVLLGINLNSCSINLADEGTDTSSNGTCINSAGIAISFPPVRDSDARNFAGINLKRLGVKKIRFAENWKYREPSQGNFDWTPLDNRINWVTENNFELLLTIQSDIPDWSAADENLTDFTIYITALLARYPGKISKIQFGNEWDTEYTGTMADFVAFNNVLHDTAKLYSPQTKVVLGGITRSYPIIKIYCDNGSNHDLLDFSQMQLASGWTTGDLYQRIDNNLPSSGIKDKVEYVLQNAKYDIVDIHLYDDAENWSNYVNAFSAAAASAVSPAPAPPVIVSEFGGPSSEYENVAQDYQAERLDTYLNVISSMNILEAYFFKLVDSEDTYHSDSGLFDTSLNRKETYSVFYNFARY